MIHCGGARPTTVMCAASRCTGGTASGGSAGTATRETGSPCPGALPPLSPPIELGDVAAIARALVRSLPVHGRLCEVVGRRLRLRGVVVRQMTWLPRSETRRSFAQQVPAAPLCLSRGRRSNNTQPRTRLSLKAAGSLCTPTLVVRGGFADSQHQGTDTPGSRSPAHVSRVDDRRPVRH